MNPDKLSPEARIVLYRDAAGPVRILAAIHGEIDQFRRAHLETLGCRVRSVAAGVITAELPVGSLAALSDLAFVRYIEVSRSLSPERQSPGG
jgi:hypothetical protein